MIMLISLCKDNHLYWKNNTFTQEFDKK